MPLTRRTGIRDQGVAEGAANTLDFTGAGVSVANAGGVAVVTIPGGGGGGGSTTVGTAVIDFGSFPGTTDANVVVTGQASIVAGSTVSAWIRPDATAIHSADEHVMACAMIDVVAGEIVAGTGFTIRAVARDLGGERLEVPGANRKALAHATAANNTMREPTAIGSVGGTCLNRIWGTFTIDWAWN